MQSTIELPADTGTTACYHMFLQLCHDRVLTGTFADFALQEIMDPTVCNTSDFRQVTAMGYVTDLLERRGYLTYAKGDSTGTAILILDSTYRSDKLLKDRLACYFNALFTYDSQGNVTASTFDLDQAFYFLQDETNHTYITTEKAALGGNRNLKIYGRLDCPNANRYVKLGKYQKVRVFFKDEETAIAAGYRPCGICMREKYLIWKKSMESSPENKPTFPVDPLP